MSSFIKATVKSKRYKKDLRRRPKTQSQSLSLFDGENANRHDNGDVYPRENCIAPAIVFIVWTTDTRIFFSVEVSWEIVT